MDSVPAEPSQHDVAQIVAQLAGAQPEMVVGIGGGSVLDVAKLLSVLLHPASPALNALIDGEKPRLRLASLLIPATAGTGSEATPNAILAIPERNTKVGIISPVLLPDFVALLPETDHQHACGHCRLHRNRCAVSSPGMLYFHRREPGER